MKKIRLLTVSVLLLIWHSAAAQNELEPLSNISDAAQEFALSQLDRQGLSDISASVQALDARLRLARCEQALETSSNSQHRNFGNRISVRVRCSGERPWSLYVPVTINATVSIIKVTEPLPRGHILSNADYQQETYSIDQLPAHYLTDPDAVNGMELNRGISRPTILTVNMIKEPNLITKGQEVTILLAGNSFEVRMSGTALEDGTAGSRIPVENRTSGRVIQAKIVGSSLVTVGD